MGQGDSVPAEGNSSFQRNKPKKHRSGLSSILDGGHCESASNHPRAARADAQGATGRRGAKRSNFTASHVPTNPIRCTPTLNSHESYMRQALQEEMAWQQQQQQGSAASSPAMAHASAKRTSASSRTPTAGANAYGQVALLSSREEFTSRSGTVVTPADPLTPAEASRNAARRHERRWWLMLCEVLIAVQHLSQAQKETGCHEAGDGNNVTDTTAQNPISFCVRRAMQEVAAEEASRAAVRLNAGGLPNPNPTLSGGPLDVAEKGTAPERSRSSSLRPGRASRQRNTSPAPSATALELKRRHSENPIPLPREAMWVPFPAGRSTGVEYFAPAPRRPASQAGETTLASRAPATQHHTERGAEPGPAAHAVEQLADNNGTPVRKNSSSSEGEDKTKSHPSVPGLTANHSVTSNASEMPTGLAASSGATVANTATATTTAAAFAVASSPSSTPSPNPVALPDLCALPWQVPPAGLEELPIGPSYFAVLRRAWSADPKELARTTNATTTTTTPPSGHHVTDDDTAEAAANPLGLDTSTALASRLASSGSDGVLRDYGSLVGTSSLADSSSSGAAGLAYDRPATAPAAAAAPRPRVAKRGLSPDSAAAVPNTWAPAEPVHGKQTPEPISDEELAALMAESPNAPVLAPAVPLAQMLRVLSPDWVEEGLYETANVAEPAYVRQLYKARQSGKKSAGSRR